MEISWKLYAGKFLGNYMLGNFLETICREIFWKLYAGNLLMETICWEIRGGYQRLFDGGNYGTLATASYCGFKAMVPGALLSIPAVQTFLERSEGSYREGEQGDGNAQPMLATNARLGWVVRQGRSELEGFILTMT